jgi:hypothetical protein
VRLEVFRQTSMDTISHEAGHMLGLGDEASGENGQAGAFVGDADYAGLVHYRLQESVLRADDTSIMSRRDKVRPRHYITFLEALIHLTDSEGWTIAGATP